MKEAEGGGPGRRGGAHHPYESSWEGKGGERALQEKKKTIDNRKCGC